MPNKAQDPRMLFHSLLIQNCVLFLLIILFGLQLELYLCESLLNRLRNRMKEISCLLSSKFLQHHRQFVFFSWKLFFLKIEGKSVQIFFLLLLSSPLNFTSTTPVHILFCFILCWYARNSTASWSCFEWKTSVSRGTEKKKGRKEKIPRLKVKDDLCVAFALACYPAPQARMVKKVKFSLRLKSFLLSKVFVMSWRLKGETADESRPCEQNASHYDLGECWQKVLKAIIV